MITSTITITTIMKYDDYDYNMQLITIILYTPIKEITDDK